MRLKASTATNRNQRSSAAWGMRIFLLVAVAFMARFSMGQQSEIRAGKLAPELQRLAEQAQTSPTANHNVRVIVQFKQTPTQHHFDKVQARGGKLSAHLELVNGGAFSLPASALKDLADDDEVLSISSDNALRGMDDFNDYAVQISSTWSAGYNGSGIGVAIIDSGINDTQTDFIDQSTGKSQVVYHQDFTGTATSNSSGAKWDLYGHGTHVAGIVGGTGTMSDAKYAGLAPHATLIDLRVLDQFGNGTDSNVIAAIQKAIALKSTYNIRVINLSLGRGISTSYA
ncbi:MAG: S8 family serine peptidase, partial [Terriglobales bacterium]